MIVDVLAIKPQEGSELATGPYLIRLSVDGQEYTLQLARSSGPAGALDPIEILDFTDPASWDLFRKDTF